MELCNHQQQGILKHEPGIHFIMEQLIAETIIGFNKITIITCSSYNS